MRKKKNLASSTFLVLALSMTMWGQQARVIVAEDVQSAEKKAENIIEALRVSGNIDGLAAYVLEVVKLYREQRAVLEEQSALNTSLMEDRATFIEGLNEIRVALEAERASRDALSDRLMALEEPRWKHIFSGGTQGGAIGAAIGKDVTGVMVGTSVGIGLAWVLKLKL